MLLENAICGAKDTFLAFSPVTEKRGWLRPGQCTLGQDQRRRKHLGPDLRLCPGLGPGGLVLGGMS